MFSVRTQTRINVVGLDNEIVTTVGWLIDDRHHPRPLISMRTNHHTKNSTGNDVCSFVSRSISDELLAMIRKNLSI